MQCQEKFYNYREQRKAEYSQKFEESRKQLNLQLNYEGIYEGRSRIQSVYPIYLRPNSVLSKS